MNKNLPFGAFLIFLFTFAFNYCEAQWEPDVRLTNATGNSFTSDNNAWCVAANGNVVHVVWRDNRDGNYEIYYKRSSNSGMIWGTDKRLTNFIGTSIDPSIAVSGSDVHIVWKDYRDNNYEIYYKRSTDGGVNWGADTRLTNNSAESTTPSIAVSGSNVHIVWEDNCDGNEEIYVIRSTDGGINWGANTRLTNDTNFSRHPSIAISGSNVHVAWEDYRDSNYGVNIYYKRSVDGGTIWEADTRLTNISSSSFPSIAISGSNVHIVWEDYRDNCLEIYYKRSTDAGIYWGSDTRLTNNSANSHYPSIAVSSTIVHVVWTDARDYNPEIYYKSSTDGGTNWETDIRLTNNSADSRDPSIAVYSSNLHIVWEDFRDNNYEIYYKRNPTGNVGIKNISAEIPSTLSLEQNYPNPFNPVTKIRFAIPETGFTTLKIYDMLGREVQTLVNENLQPGTYESSFDGSNLNSGIYFYRLQTESFTETKKMILIK